MRKVFLLALLTVGLLVGGVSETVAQKSKKSEKTPTSVKTKDTKEAIVTVVPAREKGQIDVLELRCEPIKNVRVAFIGLGMRGPGAVERMMNVPGVEIVALCDIDPKNTAKVNKRLVAGGRPSALEFSGDSEIWRKVTALPNVDLVYIATDWKNHAKMGVQAMKDGKHVAIEVPAAMTLQEIWDLVNTSEQTRKHCMQLENCVYDFFELTTLNMAQQGVFGEVLHTEGAYIHNLEGFWDSYWNDWRLDYNINFRGDVYPTHGLGPACQLLNIHRGDKMNYLVSMQTKAVSIPDFIYNKQKNSTYNREIPKEFKNGDHTLTLIRTENGKTINIQHNVATPRPYSRMYQLTGTKGFANKYPSTGYSLEKGQVSKEDLPNHEDLDGHSFVSESVKKALMEKFKHPIHKELEETAKKVGGHGGMDYIMDYRMIYCIQNGLPLDMDVYDLAEWCSLAELTRISIENGSKPVEVPDFTRGAWKNLNKLKFYYADGK